jgi:predicted dehydrogenase
MSGRRVNVGVVGCGAIASSIHIPVWRKISNTRLIGVYDIAIEKAKFIASKYRIAKVYGSLEDLIEDDEIDLVDVCTPIHTHISIIEKALKAGKHVITEKPLAPSSNEALHVMELAKSKKLVLAVSQNHIYSNAVRGLKNRIIRGDLGELLFLNVTYPLSIYKPKHWTANPATGGLLFELGIHPSYIAIYLFGKPDSVHAFGNIPSPEQKVGYVTAVLRKGSKICTIVLPPVETQPTIRAYGSKAFAITNLFADTTIFNEKRIALEYEYAPMRSLTQTGISSAKDWLSYSAKIAMGYVKRGTRYFIQGAYALNQFKMFNEVVAEILTNDEKLRESNRLHLEVALESIRLLENIRKNLNVGAHE